LLDLPLEASKAKQFSLNLSESLGGSQFYRIEAELQAESEIQHTEMAAKNFSVKQDEHGTYQLEGELSIHELEEFRAFLDNSLKGGQEIAISLSNVRYIDTAALQLLIAFMKRFGPEVKLRISAVSNEVEDILSLSGLKAAFM